jgi:alanine racemase
MQRSQNYSTWVEVDLEAIENNVAWITRRVSAAAGAQVMAVVKANGYGHGAIPVARAALRGGATWCGVARIEEALDLRQAGLNCPVLLLGFNPEAQVEEAIRQGISQTVWSMEQLLLLSSAARKVGLPARIHLKVDTGMSRLGVQPSGALELARAATSLRDIDFQGIFTHFARADEADRRATDDQEHLFRELLERLDQSGLRPPLVHASNSAASLTRPSAYFNLVRAGIAIYGLHPSPDCPLPEGFRPALNWKSVLSLVKILPPGRGLSYGHIYVTRSNERIGTVPVGYADGFRRITGNQVLIHGQRVPVVGRVCMDQILVQLDEVPEARAGDEVVLIGMQGEESLTAEQVAQTWGTINYEVVCGIGSRVPRLYHGAK